MCSDNCKTSIVDYHRNWSGCDYDLCLTCSHELRLGHQPGGDQSESTQQKLQLQDDIKGADTMEVNAVPAPLPWWEAGQGGRIPCPPKSQGGCGGLHTLQLKTLFEPDWLAKLTTDAANIAATCHNLKEQDSMHCSICGLPDPDRRKHLRLAAHWEIQILQIIWNYLSPLLLVLLIIERTTENEPGRFFAEDSKSTDSSSLMLFKCTFKISYRPLARGGWIAICKHNEFQQNYPLFWNTTTKITLLWYNYTLAVSTKDSKLQTLNLS